VIAHEFRLMLVATQFFTRLPVPAFKQFDPAWLSQSARYFPLVGALVGGLSAATLWLGAQVLPMPIAALVALAVSMIITGAFHEDGLADTFDALGGAVSRERALEIMKDSRIGTYGAIALGISLALRWQLVAALPLHLAMTALVVAHTAARSMAGSIMASLVYVRDQADAKAKPVAHSLSTTSLVVSVLIGAAPCVAAVYMQPSLVQAWTGALVAMIVVREVCVRWFRTRLGGYTGDTLGCAEQFGEIAALLVVVALVR
jgi:adenosylcobinamide-GDP ribazoletransferase